MVNFGSILTETSKKIVISMSNVSEMGINYEWSFIEEELATYPIERDASSDGRVESRQSIRDKQKYIPINEIFDILPLSGYLEPGQNEQVEFVYNAITGQRFKTTAICHVEGGPNYEVTLIGDSSLINYKLNTDLIELADQRFCDFITRDIYIENTGKVTFEFKVILTQVKKKGFVDAFPLSGRIAGGEKQKITVKVCAVMPSEFKEQILVQVGYFEPQVVTITGKGIYP